MSSNDNFKEILKTAAGQLEIAVDDEKLEKFYYSLYLQIDADPDLRFPNLLKDNPLPPHPVQGYDAARPDWKPGQ